MNNKLNANFSMRKLLLTAFVAAPLATLPAPLWALPDVSATNLTSSAGVITQVVGTNTLNITAPDKAILSWQAFGTTGSTIAAGDVLNYFLPSSTASVLNSVAGGAPTVINGTISSNGNVYILNPAGILLTPTAQVNVGGFYASTVNEPSGFFSINGSLSFTGPSTANVVVQGTGTSTGTNTATIQAVGPGNNIYLAGAGVDVQGGKFFGNLFVRSTSATANITTSFGGLVTDSAVSGVNTAFGSTGPVSINLVGSPLVGGALNVATNGGNVLLSGGSQAAATAALTGNSVSSFNVTSNGSLYSTTPTVNISGGGGTGAVGTPVITGGQLTGITVTSGGAGYTSAPTVTISTPSGGTVTIAPNVGSTTGAVTINTSSSGTNGNITQGGSAFTANTTGTVVNLNAGTGSTSGLITLNTIDALTVAASGNNITLSDIAGGVTLTGTNAYGNLTVNSASTILQGTAAQTVGGVVTFAPSSGSTVSFTGTGNITFSNLGSSASTVGTTTISTSGDLTTAGIVASNALSLTSTAGQITTGSITTSSTLTISATNATAGKLTAQKIVSATGTITVANDITITGGAAPVLQNTGGSTLTVTSTAGNITTGAISASSTLNLTATAGSITTGNLQSNTLNVTAANGTVTIGNLSTANTAVVSSTGITTGNINANSSALTLTATTGTITTGTIATNSTLTITAPSAAGTITTGSITSTTTRTVTLSSGGAITLAPTGSITVPVLSVTSTGGSITQVGAITSTSSATFNAAGDIILTNAGNDFNTIVLQGGNGATGVQVTDKNDISIGGGTNVAGAAVITAGAGIAAYTSVPTVSITNPNITATATSSINTSVGGIVSALSLNNQGGGYITSTPTVTLTGGGGTGATANATWDPTTGRITALTITNAGSGYTSAPTVSFTGTQGTASTATAVLSGGTSGVVTGVNFVAGTSPFASTPTVSFTGGGGSGAVASASVNASGNITAISAVQSGSILLGTQAIDSLSFGSTLNLTTTGIAGTNGVVNYSQISTPANSVRIFGNVTISTNNTNATLGNNVFGNAANYSFGQVNANLGAGATGGVFTVVESQTLNLGNVTASSLNATSLAANIVNTGKLTVPATGTSTFSANSIFNPGDISLNFGSNTLSGPIVIANSHDFNLTNTVSTTVTAGSGGGKAGTGATNVTVIGAGNTLTLNVAAGGDYNTVGFSAPGVVTVTDVNGLTLQNASSTGAGTVTVTSSGPIVLGSGIVLGSTGVTTINSTYVGGNPTANISDSAPGIRVFGELSLVSAGNIAITQAGHSFGAVNLTTNAATAIGSGSTLGTIGLQNITFTEGGTLNLKNVSVGTTNYPGSLTVVSTGGGIQQAVGGTIVVPNYTPVPAATTASFTAGNGGVNIANVGNNIVPAVSVTAVGNSSILQSTGNNLVLGNVTVSGGIFSADTTGTTGLTISQVAGSSAKIYGNTSFTTQGGKITVTNSGNNFGGVTLNSTAGAQAAGADVAITETGVLNFLSVASGTGGKFTAMSENASIIQSGTAGIVVGGASSLTANTAGSGITLTGTANLFGGNTGILVTAAGNVSITDGSAITALAGGTNIAGSLSLKNTQGAGTIKDTPGILTVSGNVLFDTTTAVGSQVSIGTSTASLGAIQFRSGTVNIVENATLNLAAGSVASGPVTLTAAGNIITTGAGGGTFQNTLTLNSTGGSITITNPIFVNSGLTFHANGAVDLSSLSLAGNLNSIAPNNLGASSYKAPSP